MRRVVLAANVGEAIILGLIELEIKPFDPLTPKSLPRTKHEVNQ